MARITITLTDDKDGLVRCSAEFDPPVDRDDRGTPAQHAAAQMLDVAVDAAESRSTFKFSRKSRAGEG